MSSYSDEVGVLYIVATPIGNLQDLSPRAIEVLNSVDLILCEDTRHSALLLSNFGIKTKTKAVHEHNEVEVAQRIVDELKTGRNYALVSDAGTPMISDPGFVLTRLCHENNVKVIPVPGCCAFVTALSASGLPSNKFMFFGFISQKNKTRQEQMQSLLNADYTSIFYESSHRIEKTLIELHDVIGSDRKVCLARELTKQFETIITAPISQIVTYIQADNNHRKGEFVILIEPVAQQENNDLSREQQEVINLLLEQEVSPSVVIQIMQKIYGLNRKQLYGYVHNLNSNNDAD